MKRSELRVRFLGRHLRPVQLHCSHSIRIGSSCSVSPQRLTESAIANTQLYKFESKSSKDGEANITLFPIRRPCVRAARCAVQHIWPRWVDERLRQGEFKKLKKQVDELVVEVKEKMDEKEKKNKI